MAVNLMGDFRRDVSFQLNQREDGRIALTGTMRDVYHDILIEVLVNGETLVIEAAMAEFRKCPESGCHDSAQRLEKLIGVTIGKGLNRRILEVLGGEEGCGNLRLLLTGMLPLAMNVKAAEGFQDQEDMMDSIRERLQGSCAGYAVSSGRTETSSDKETALA